MTETAKKEVSTYSTAVEEPSAHQALILKLFEQQGQMPSEAQRNYDWFYSNHVFLQFRLQVLHRITDHDDEAVGVVSMVSRNWVCGDQHLELALLGNLVVDQHHRSLGPAIKLLRETLETLQRSVDYGYLLPNTKSEPLLKRMGATRLGDFSRYAKPFRTRSLLAQHPRLARFAFLAPLLDLLVALEELPRRLLGPRLKVEINPVIDARFDDLWRDCNKEDWLIGERGAEYLRWRTRDYPKTDMQLFVLTHPRSGDIQGYIAFSRDECDNTFMVDDLLCRDGLKGIKPLMVAFIRYARQQKGRAVSFWFYGDPRVTAILKSLHLLKRGSRPIYAAPGRLGTDVMQNRNWYFTQIDEDQ